MHTFRSLPKEIQTLLFYLSDDNDRIVVATFYLLRMLCNYRLPLNFVFSKTLPKVTSTLHPKIPNSLLETIFET